MYSNRRSAGSSGSGDGGDAGPLHVQHRHPADDGGRRGEDRPVQQLRGGLRRVRVIGGAAETRLERPGVGAAFLRRVTGPPGGGEEHHLVGGRLNLRAGQQRVPGFLRRVPPGGGKPADQHLGARRGDRQGDRHAAPPAARGRHRRRTCPPQPPALPPQRHARRIRRASSCNGTILGRSFGLMKSVLISAIASAALHQMARPPAILCGQPGRVPRRSDAQRTVATHSADAGEGRVHPHEPVPWMVKSVLKRRQIPARGACSPRRVNRRGHVHVEDQPGRVEDPARRVAVIRRVGHVGGRDVKEQVTAAPAARAARSSRVSA